MTATSSDGFIVRFNIDDVLNGGADDLARSLLTIWTANEGRLCDQIAGFTNHLVILDGRPFEADSPPLLFHGEDSLLNRNLGMMAANDSPQIKRSDFSADYRQIVAQTYLDTALQKQPIFDLVRVSHPMKTGQFQKLTYHRLLLPVTTDQGAQFTLCYSLDLETIRYPAESSQPRRRPGAGRSSNTSPNMPCFPAAYPK